MKKKIKMLIDIIMFGLFLYLMSYHAGSGLFYHGVLGTLLFILFIVHHILNINWYKALPKGNYTSIRKLYIIVDFLFLAAMIVMAVSSVMMSGGIFAFSPVPMTHIGRNLHIASTAWGFVIMAFHIGLHTHGAFSKLDRKINAGAATVLYRIVCLILVLAGIFSFVRSGLWGKLILRMEIMTAYSTIGFYTEYILMVIAACLIMHFVMKSAIKKNTRNIQKL